MTQAPSGRPSSGRPPSDRPPSDPAPVDADDGDEDWTWVLTRACPECGFDASSVPGPQVGRILREATERWSTVIARPGVTQRPAPGVWSPAEYQCHVRDVCLLFAERLRLILDQDAPVMHSWDQDAAAVSERYDEQDPALVADDLVDAAHDVARAFEGVRGDQWQRTGRRSDGSVFTVETLGRYLLHEVVHHLHDVGA